MEDDYTPKDSSNGSSSQESPSGEECQNDVVERYKEHAQKATLLYAYLSADFDNYKKRIERERSQWIDQTIEDVLITILPIMDDIDRGLAEVRSEAHPDLHVKGLELIAKAFGRIFIQYGIEEIPYSKTFDPQLFEAIMRAPSDKHASGEVVAILRKGYTRKGKVLRPAEVSVAE